MNNLKKNFFLLILTKNHYIHMLLLMDSSLKQRQFQGIYHIKRIKPNQVCYT